TTAKHIIKPKANKILFFTMSFITASFLATAGQSHLFGFDPYRYMRLLDKKRYRLDTLLIQ
ncbi:MAG: hypothetical protein PVG40_16155, partial [Desulfobacterales bacterium]